MNAKDRIMAALRHEAPDVIPVTVYTMLMPRGQGERELRNMGLGLVEIGYPVLEIRTADAVMQTHENVASFSADVDHMLTIPKQKHVVRRTYTSPKGSVTEKYKWGYTLVEWPSEWAIKNPADYEVVKSIIDGTEYIPNHEGFVKAQEIMGSDGIVILQTVKSPLQHMLLELMGYKRFALDYRMCRREFDELYRVIYKKQLEMYKVVADSPAEFILFGDNVTGAVTSPELFEKYCMPFYSEAIGILHKKDKVVMNHLDGRLRSLCEMIAKTDFDVIEAFTPPPIGDLSLEDARRAWKGKVIWANFPATVDLEGGLERVKEQTLSMLRAAAPGDDFLLGITEDIGDILSMRYEQVLKAITSTVMNFGMYPVTMP